MGFWDWIRPGSGGPDVPGVPVGPAEPQGPAPQQDSAALRPQPAEWWTGGVPDECHEMSAAFEAFRSEPYRDSAGVWTIGLGSTRDAAGRPVTAGTPPVTRVQAEDMARRDLARAEMLVAQACPGGLPTRWAAACILLANNMGSLTIKAPTLVRLLTAQDWRGAAEALKLYRNSGGRPVLGLRRRRWAEAAYTLGMPMAEAYRRAWGEIRTVDDWPALP